MENQFTIKTNGKTFTIPYSYIENKIIFLKNLYEVSNAMVYEDDKNLTSEGIEFIQNIVMFYKSDKILKESIRKPLDKDNFQKQLKDTPFSYIFDLYESSDTEEVKKFMGLNLDLINICNYLQFDDLLQIMNAFYSMFMHNFITLKVNNPSEEDLFTNEYSKIKY
jgi:hypothetical protein